MVNTTPLGEGYTRTGALWLRLFQIDSIHADDPESNSHDVVQRKDLERYLPNSVLAIAMEMDEGDKLILSRELTRLTVTALFSDNDDRGVEWYADNRLTSTP